MIPLAKHVCTAIMLFTLEMTNIGLKYFARSILIYTPKLTLAEIDYNERH